MLLMGTLLAAPANLACPLGDCAAGDGYHEVILLDLPPVIAGGIGGQGDGGMGGTAGLLPTSCGATTAGCVPGQPCPAACDCVTGRERAFHSGFARTVDRCILAPGQGAPAVEIWSHQDIPCL